MATSNPYENLGIEELEKKLKGIKTIQGIFIGIAIVMVGTFIYSQFFTDAEQNIAPAAGLAAVAAGFASTSSSKKKLLAEIESRGK